MAALNLAASATRRQHQLSAVSDGSGSGSGAKARSTHQPAQSQFQSKPRLQRNKHRAVAGDRLAGGRAGAASEAAAPRPRSYYDDVVSRAYKADGGGSLTLTDARLGDPVLPSLRKKLESPRGCAQLALQGNQLSADAVGKLAQTLPRCVGLQGLYMSSNPEVGDNGASSLAGKLLRCRTLRTVRLDSCAIGDIGASALFENLPYCTIETLGLLANMVGNKACKVLSRVMREKGFKKVRSINLERNEIGDAGVAALAGSLGDCPHLKLHLAYNLQTNEKGARAFARGLKVQAREARVQQLFNQIDVDGSGKLDRDEVRDLAAALGKSLVASLGSITVSERRLDEAFAEMDPNGDGSVDLDEFRDWYNKRVAEDEDGGKEPEQESRAEEMAVELAASAATGEMITTLREDALKEKVWGMRRSQDWPGLLRELQDNPTDALAQEHTCWALQKVAAVSNAQRLAMVTSGAIEALVTSVKRACGRQNRVVQHGLHALTILIQCPSSQARASVCKACETTIECLAASSLTVIQRRGCALLTSLCFLCPKNQMITGGAGGIQQVTAALTDNPTVGAVQEPAMKALAAICGLGSQNFPDSVDVSPPNAINIARAVKLGAYERARHARATFPWTLGITAAAESLMHTIGPIQTGGVRLGGRHPSWQ